MKNVILSGGMVKRNSIGRFLEERRTIIMEGTAALLILLFVYTALSKLTKYVEFKNQLLLYPFVKHFNIAVSFIVPGLELIISLLLFLPKTRKLGFYGSIILLIAFTIYLLLMIIFGGKHLPCTCGGVIQMMTWKQHIFFNLGFIILNLLAISLLKKKQTEIERL